MAKFFSPNIVVKGAVNIQQFVKKKCLGHSLKINHLSNNNPINPKIKECFVGY